MSNFLHLTQTVIATKTMTPEIEQQLDQILWSRDFSPAEMVVLRQLQYMLARGLIKVTPTQAMKVQ